MEWYNVVKLDNNSVELILKFMIKEITPNQTSLVYNAFYKVNYRDAFRLSFETKTFNIIDEFALQYFLSQPNWLRLISMNTISKEKMEENLEQSNFQINTNIGSWKIFNRNENEIVFGESMGFMDYRFSMRLDKHITDNIEVSTVVTLNGFMGKYYFALVKLMHKKFVMLSLKNVAEKHNTATD